MGIFVIHSFVLDEVVRNDIYAHSDRDNTVPCQFTTISPIDGSLPVIASASDSPPATQPPTNNQQPTQRNATSPSDRRCSSIHESISTKSLRYLASNNTPLQVRRMSNRQPTKQP